MTPPTAPPTLTVAPGGRSPSPARPPTTTPCSNVEISPAQQHHAGEPRRRRHVGRRRDRGLVPHLARPTSTHQLQLDLHDAVQPDAGPVLVHGPGDRRRRPDDVVDQPGPADHQRARCPGTPPPNGLLERHRHRLQHRGAAPRPRRHRHRRHRRGQRPGRASRTTTPAATCSPTAPWRRPSPPSRRDAGHAERDQHDLDARGGPADQGRLRGHGVRVRHRRPAGPVDHGRDGQLPGLPG